MAENPTYFAEFADEAFAECEEHLISIRKKLLELENFIGKDKIDISISNDLFRGFHTLKGISGMIGMKESELVAHKIENFLKMIQKSVSFLNQSAYESIIKGTRAIEQIISLYHDKKDINEINERINLEEIFDELDNLIKVTTPSTSDKIIKAEKELTSSISFTDDEKDKLNSALSRNETIWKFQFIPSAELFNKGINVNIIRNKLQTVGTIIHSSPSKSEQEKISFVFIVSVKNEKKDFPELANSGLSYSIFQKEKEFLETRKDSENINKQIKSEPKSNFIASSNVIRVELTKLDELMKLVGDLVINRARLEDYLKNMEGEIPVHSFRVLQETNQSIERQLRNLREGVMSVRLVPIGEVFERMQFVVRDLIRESKKLINLQIEGKETEIDKFVIEKIFDPLLHLVRNSVSHGLEHKDERIKKGKSESGNLKLKAFTSGDAVIIEIEDDGKGIDKEKVIEKALESGLINQQTKIDNSILLDIICSPGFSTKDETDLISGRGVGMSVVKNTIQELGGMVELWTEKDKGTKFTIHLPLTLAIVDALIGAVGHHTFAIPLPSVNEVLTFEKQDIKYLENNEFITHRGKILPLLRLSDFFDIQSFEKDIFYALIIGSEQNSIGVVIDKIKSLREIVIRSLDDPLVKIKGVAGATELGDGKIVLILDGSEIINNTKQNKIMFTQSSLN